MYIKSYLILFIFLMLCYSRRKQNGDSPVLSWPPTSCADCLYGLVRHWCWCRRIKFIPTKSAKPQKLKRLTMDMPEACSHTEMPWGIAGRSIGPGIDVVRWRLNLQRSITRRTAETLTLDTLTPCGQFRDLENKSEWLVSLPLDAECKGSANAMWRTTDDTCTCWNWCRYRCDVTYQIGQRHGSHTNGQSFASQVLKFYLEWTIHLLGIIKYSFFWYLTLLISFFFSYCPY